MSWSFHKAGSPSKVVAAMRESAEKAQASCEPEVQAAAATLVEQQLSVIPEDHTVIVTGSGHRGVNTYDGKTTAYGQLELKVQIVPPA